MKLLEGVSVIDLTHRLPGPLAGKLLSDMGASVTKIEDHHFTDPFKNTTFSAMDDSFKAWYLKLNESKKILSFNYKNKSDQEQIVKLCKSADIILMGLPLKLEKKFGLDKLNHPHASIKMIASENSNESMHDLNVLAKLGYLKRHVQEYTTDVIPPPFFPVAGMSFSHSIVTHALAAFYQATQKKEVIRCSVSLEKATRDLFEPLHVSDQEKFLHNGRYPCYNIYHLKDGHIALACLEEKFWQRLCESFSFNLSLNDRFYDQDDKIKQNLALTFKTLSKKQALALIDQQDMCVSVF